MRVFITRAAPEAGDTAARVAQRGHTPIVSPALVIEPIAFEFDPRDVQALLFTSAAGVRAFGRQAIPALAVGEGTAEAARAAGYGDVRSADGAARDLVQLAKRLDPRAGRVVHVGGADIAYDIAAALAEAGFDARRLVVYRASAAAGLSPQAVNALETISPGDSVLFHSARGAEFFCRIVEEARLRAQAVNLSALCLGRRAAEIAARFDFANVIVAPTPREDDLLGLLNDVAANHA